MSAWGRGMLRYRTGCLLAQGTCGGGGNIKRSDDTGSGAVTWKLNKNLCENMF